MRHVDLLAASIAENGGRSCVNASGMWVAASHADGCPGGRRKARGDRAARGRRRAGHVGAFADPRVAERSRRRSTATWRRRARGKSRSSYRSSPGWPRSTAARICSRRSCCATRPEHPLANREFLFPYAAVVAVSAEEMRRMPQPMGKTLVVTALTGDRASSTGCSASSLVDRLNIGAIQTNRSVGISRTKGTCSSTSTHGARSSNGRSGTRRRRRVRILSFTGGAGDDVLRQLPAGQRAGRRAAGARPRRRPDAGLHADPHGRAQRQPDRRCSSAVSASSSSSMATVPPHAAGASIGCGMRRGRSGWRRSGRSRSIRRASVR